MDIYDPIGIALGLEPMHFDFKEDLKNYPKITSVIPSPFKGQKHTEHAKQMLSTRSRIQWENGKKVFSQEQMSRGTRAKYGVDNIRHLQGECPHCGKQGQLVALKRWHFDNCKHQAPISINW